MNTTAEPVQIDLSAVQNELSICSRCKKKKPTADFIGVRKKNCTTCLSCRQFRPKQNDKAKAWRAKQKALGVTVDKRGKSRAEYMKQYKRREVPILLLTHPKATKANAETKA
jgi:hypothetical protein